MISRKRLYKSKKIAKRLFYYYHGSDPTIDHSNLTEEQINYLQGIYRKTKKPCSCSCCGNPRKWFGNRTVQEKKYDTTVEQLEEYYVNKQKKK